MRTKAADITTTNKCSGGGRNNCKSKYIKKYAIQYFQYVSLILELINSFDRMKDEPVEKCWLIRYYVRWICAISPAVKLHVYVYLLIVRYFLCVNHSFDSFSEQTLIVFVWTLLYNISMCLSEWSCESPRVRMYIKISIQFVVISV